MLFITWSGRQGVNLLIGGPGRAVEGGHAENGMQINMCSIRYLVTPCCCCCCPCAGAAAAYTGCVGVWWAADQHLPQQLHTEGHPRLHLLGPAGIRGT